MAEVVGDLPIQDEFAVLDASSSFRDVSSSLMSSSVKIIFVRDPSIDRIIGVMTENMFLQVIASGINPSRTKLATHMLPNKTSKRGLLRLTRDAPLADAIQLAIDTNPFAIIVEGIKPQKKSKGSSAKSQLLGYLSPSDLKSATIPTQDKRKELTKKTDLVMNIEKAFMPRLEAAPALYRTLNSDESFAASESVIGLDVAEQIVSIANQLLVTHKVDNSSAPVSFNNDPLFCIVAEASQITSVWPVSVSEIPTFPPNQLVYKLAWADNLLNFTGDTWATTGPLLPSKSGFSVMAIVTSKLGRVNEIHDIIKFRVKGKSNLDLIQGIASQLNSINNSKNKVLICVESISSNVKA